MATKKSTKSKKKPVSKSSLKSKKKVVKPKKAVKKSVKKASAKKASANKKTKKTPVKKTSSKKTVKKTVKKQRSASVKKKSSSKKNVTKKQSSKNKTVKKKVAKKVTSKGAATIPKIPASAKFLKDKGWLKKQKEELVSKRATYTASADRLAEEARALMEDRDPGDVQFDEESGEGDTLAVERDRDLALSAQARQAVEEIDMALERLEKGVYGLCTSAGDVIPKARLEFIPEASVCVEHKTSMFL